mmetsp:Transcript_46770/g.92353  ORF Transcript_46770/g.92353 Transcript_46770/m.92353 type:complete len:90 (-) Transcript_46770:430-699(-)
MYIGKERQQELTHAMRGGEEESRDEAEEENGQQSMEQGHDGLNGKGRGGAVLHSFPFPRSLLNQVEYSLSRFVSSGSLVPRVLFWSAVE